MIEHLLAMSPSRRLIDGIACCLLGNGRSDALAEFIRRNSQTFENGWLNRRNIARNKSALQSSTSEWSRHRDPQQEASGANDGDRQIECGCHTGAETDPWWSVDLGAISKVWTVEIINRRHMAGRLAGFRLEASADDAYWSVLHQDDATQVAPHYIIIDLPEPVTCRWLRITVPGHTSLHIVEFSAFGFHVADPSAGGLMT